MQTPHAAIGHRVQGAPGLWSSQCLFGISIPHCMVVGRSESMSVDLQTVWIELIGGGLCAVCGGKASSGAGQVHLEEDPDGGD